MNFWKMNALILKYIFCCAKIDNLNIDDLMIIVIQPNRSNFLKIT